jgi:prepilin-type N-terminal cleavage/methylation domain-containing protein
MKKPRNLSCRGFTLIELMIVVAIIGVIASMVIPVFQNMTLRSRIAERDPIMRAIAKGVEDYALNAASVPVVFGGTFNPAGAPGTSKQAWVQSQGNWGLLPMIVEGATYCTYKFDLDGASTPVNLIVVGDCDIDGDAVHSMKIQTYSGYGNAFVLVAESTPASNLF